MTAPKNIAPGAPEVSLDTNAGFKIANSPNGSQTFAVNKGMADVLDSQREAVFVREMITWKTPHLGYVQMYINPQQLTINEGKDISDVRTKAGFIMQYGGEKLTEISIHGTTGSSGMEGINILEQIYRAEQYAFEPIASAL